jgi:hypothetical protein
MNFIRRFLSDSRGWGPQALMLEVPVMIDGTRETGRRIG